MLKGKKVERQIETTARDVSGMLIGKTGVLNAVQTHSIKTNIVEISIKKTNEKFRYYFLGSVALSSHYIRVSAEMSQSNVSHACTRQFMISSSSLTNVTLQIISAELFKRQN